MADTWAVNNADNTNHRIQSIIHFFHVILLFAVVFMEADRNFHITFTRLTNKANRRKTQMAKSEIDFTDYDTPYECKEIWKVIPRTSRRNFS